MGLRAKLLIIVAALGALALALNLLQYRAGVRAVEDALRADARAEAAGLAQRLEGELAGAGDAGVTATARALGDYAGALERRAPPPDAGGDDPAAKREGRKLIAVGSDGRVLFHPNAALVFQPVARAMPYFDHIGREMTAGRAGAGFYAGPADDSRWLAAYEPVVGRGLSVAAARDYTAAVAPLRLWLTVGLAASALGAGLAAGAVFVLVGRATGFVRAVSFAASRVAAGDLEQRIDETRAVGGETRALAASFNLMTDRLREHLRREAEARQFQSFFRLSAMLTHDLKNAITGLAMLVSNMERQFHREEFRADAVASVRDATDKLRSIVSRLSERADTLSGEYRRALRPVDLSALARRVIEGTAAGSFHEVEIGLPGALEVSVDPERIERVIENLVVNALEAMGARRGVLTVAAGSETEGRVFLSVADTGPGMSEEFIRTRLFRPFATTKSKGIGLGLYTCREVVEAHGGRLEVESKEGSGTRFRVVIPSAPVTHPRAAG